MAERGSPQSFAFAAGESFQLTFDVDEVITGMTVRFSAKRNSSSTAVLSTAGGTATSSIPSAQQCKITVADENTASLIGTYRYSVEVEDGAGDKSEVAWGYLTFNPKMT